jgi:hypothetical protein
MFQEMDELMQERTVDDDTEEVDNLYYYYDELDFSINRLSNIAEDLRSDLANNPDASFIYSHILDAIHELYTARDTCWDSAKFLEDFKGE